MLFSDELETVSPALAKYTHSGALADLWKRPGLSPRDRSIVTLAVLITHGQISNLHDHVVRALDNGVKPREIAEIITHLAFYSGWEQAMSAIPPTREAFAARAVESSTLAFNTAPRLPLDEASEAQRKSRVEQAFGAVAPGVLDFTTNTLFRDLWLRPNLTPRDRSLVTVSALVTSGQVAQMTFHLNRAMDNGLTQEEASEVFTQLAFYAGWPNVFSALPVAKEVFDKRTQ